MSRTPFELRNSVVRAGAGAGKTHGLIEQVVRVFDGFKSHTSTSPRIVLTTFTRKATQELKERLILRACENRDLDLLNFVSDPARLQITTIHGLMNSFLKRMGHLAGMDSGFQIVSESDAGHLARLALRETLLELPESLIWLERYKFDRLLQMLRRYSALVGEVGQLEAASLSDIEQVMTEATLTWRQELLRSITFVEANTEDKKWLSFAESLRGFVEGWDKTPTKEGLPRKPNRSAKTPEFEPLHVQVEKVLAEFREDLGKPHWNSTLWPVMAAEWAEFMSVAKSFHQRLVSQKNSQARFEMADIELKTLEILREQPLLGEIFGTDWDYWMIDEYQDTSPLQVQILKAIVGKKPRYVVGDPQQSIYFFRGAEVGVFTDAVEDLKLGGGEYLQLERNYRSNPQLLSWINDFISGLQGSFSSMLPRSSAEDVSNASGRFGARARVVLFRAADTELEYLGVAKQVEVLLAQGARLEQICVLGRTRRSLMEVSRVLRAQGYPTQVHASSGFGNRREVQDAHAVWRFLLNPHDNQNLLTLLRSPWFFVDDWQLAEWMKDRPKSLWRRLSLLHVEGPLISIVQRLQAALSLSLSMGLARAFTKILSEQGVLDLSLHNDPAGRKESNLWKLIQRAHALERDGGRSIVTLLEREMQEDLESNEGDANSAQEPNAINLLTIHGSKGLQFEHIIVVCMGEEPRLSSTPNLSALKGRVSFPIWQEELSDFVPSALDNAQLQHIRRRESEEFDRWLYVALTRAKETLTLTWSSHKKGSWADRSPWFLRSIGESEIGGCVVEVRESMELPGLFADAASYVEKVRAPFLPASVSSEGLPIETPVARQSVSQVLESLSSSPPTDFQPRQADVVLQRWQAQSLGTEIHRVLQTLKYRGPQAIEEIQVELEGEDGPTQAAVRYVLELKSPPLRQLIDQGEVEWGFQVLTANGLVEGQIDLWGKLDSKIYIVDYKTGSTAFEEKAFRQLTLYAWALRQFGHLEPIELVVIYPRTQQAVRRPLDMILLGQLENEVGRA